MTKQRNILITGFPNFVARHLFWQILDHEPDSLIFCLIHPDNLSRAKAIVHNNKLESRVRLLEGDVRALDLGLTGREFLDVTEQITDVYHTAFVSDTVTQRKLLYDVNVTGTRNVLQCVTDIKRLNRYNHFSSAFVAGKRSGVVMEQALDPRPVFRHAAEATRHEAEVSVQSLKGRIPFSIFRPSTIIGHSKTGQIDKMTGPYVFFKPMITLPVEVPFPLPGKGTGPLNLVPVDYVAAAMHAISLRPQAVGRTFHLVDPNPLSAIRVFELVAATAGKPLPRRLPGPLSQFVGHLPFLGQALQTGRDILSDFEQHVTFNASNTACLTREGPWCPQFADVVDPLVSFLRQPEDSNLDSKSP